MRLPARQIVQQGQFGEMRLHGRDGIALGLKQRDRFRVAFVLANGGRQARAQLDDQVALRLDRLRLRLNRRPQGVVGRRRHGRRFRLGGRFLDDDDVGTDDDILRQRGQRLTRHALSLPTHPRAHCPLPTEICRRCRARQSVHTPFNRFCAPKIMARLLPSRRVRPPAEHARRTPHSIRDCGLYRESRTVVYWTGTRLHSRGASPLSAVP